MFPYINDYFYDIGLDNYKILMVVAILTALIIYRFLGTRGLEAPTYNFYLLAALGSIIAGLFSAMLFQAIYNYAETGDFVFKGMTVMGGILGAAIFFIAFVFIAGLTDFGRKHKAHFWTAVNLIVPCIVIAQSIGRLGCFTAGCCYGRETDSFLGVTFVRGYLANGDKVMHENPRLPTQLFEAIFLALLFAAMLIILLKFKKKNLSALIYLYAYPVFRFMIEFLRDDHRGAFLLGLSPSQVQSLLLLAAGITLTILIYRFNIIPFAPKKNVEKAECAPSTVVENTECTFKTNVEKTECASDSGVENVELVSSSAREDSNRASGADVENAKLVSYSGVENLECAAKTRPKNTTKKKSKK